MKKFSLSIGIFSNSKTLSVAIRQHSFNYFLYAPPFLRHHASIISPELIWEGKCTEAPALIVNNERLYMFYGGAYNCSPQQIGCAVSNDGRTFEKLFINEPFIKCGDKGTWNESESGHPFAFRDVDGTAWLYYQGSNDNGNTWYLTRVKIDFDSTGKPYVIN